LSASRKGELVRVGDAFASGEKTLHGNPGRHAGVPAFELDSSERFFIRHLVDGGASVMAD
jgi:hypothetical protein